MFLGISLGFLIVSGLFALLGLVATLYHLRKRHEFSNQSALPSLSILKPIKGTEDSLEENLKSFFKQSYRGPIEIIFASTETDDQGIEIAKSVAKQFPEIPVKFVLSDPAFGLNPKVANLAGAMAHAQYDLVLQSDANVRIKPDYLNQIVDEFVDNQASLLTSIVVGAGENTIGAAIENLQLTARIAPSVCTVLHVFRVSCVIGKSMLLRRSELEKVGGLHSVRDILAEDYILGEKYQKQGFKIVLSTHVIENYNRHNSIKQFFARHNRWLMMRAVIHFGSFLGDLLINGILWSLLVMIAAHFQTWSIILMISTWIIQMGIDSFYLRKIRGYSMSMGYLLLVPLRDLIMVFVWLHACFSRSVIWRGVKLHVGKQSQVHLPKS